MLLWILAAAAVIAVCIFAFIKLYPAFGGTPDKAMKEEYARRSDNYIDGRFVYPEEYELESTALNIIMSKDEKKPGCMLPTAECSIPEDPEKGKVYITWLGHSTVLLQIGSRNILFDPVFSEYSSPVQIAGPRRFSIPPVTVDELPELDAVVLTHDHYDHLDMNSIKALNKKGVRFIVPLGVEAHLMRWGVAEENITTMAWWEETSVGGVTVTCTPAKHYSGRIRMGSNETLFASYMLSDGQRKVYFCGDSGYGGHFSEIRERCGEPDIALMEGAQYNQLWHDSHMYPEESVIACEMLGAELAMPIHWGAFSLAPHPWNDPVVRFTMAAGAFDSGVEAITPMIGATVDLDDITPHQKKWW